MFEIGDREEGGPLLVNGVEVHRAGEGVQSRAELDLYLLNEPLKSLHQ